MDVISVILRVTHGKLWCGDSLSVIRRRNRSRGPNVIDMILVRKIALQSIDSVPLHRYTLVS
jgi:hypothetical protein